MRLNKFKGPESTSNPVESSSLSERSNSNDVIHYPKCEVKNRKGKRRRKFKKRKKKKRRKNKKNKNK